MHRSHACSCTYRWHRSQSSRSALCERNGSKTPFAMQHKSEAIRWKSKAHCQLVGSGLKQAHSCMANLHHNGKGVFNLLAIRECGATFLASLAQTSLSPTNNLCRKMPRERQQEGKQKRPFVKLQETEKLDFFSRRGSHLCIHPLKVPLNKNGGEQMSLSSLLRRRYCRSKKVCRLFTGLQTRQGGCFQRCPMLLHGTNVITTNG